MCGVWWPSRGFACGSPAVIEKFDPFGAAALAVTRQVADQSSVLSAVPWRVAGLSSVLSAVPWRMAGLSSVLSAVPWRMAGLSSVLSAVPWRVVNLSSVLSAVPWRVAGLSSVLSAVPWRMAGLSSVLSAVPWRVAGLSSVLSAVPQRVADLSSVLSAARRPHYSITAGKPQAHPRNGTPGRMWAPRGSNARGGIWRELVSGAARWHVGPKGVQRPRVVHRRHAAVWRWAVGQPRCGSTPSGPKMDGCSFPRVRFVHPRL